MKPSELACLSYLDALEGERGLLPDDCDIAQLEADGLIRMGAAGQHELTPTGKVRLANLRTLERQDRREA